MSSSRFCGDSGKKSPYCCMNCVELFLRVFAAGIGVEHVVERAHHLAHALEILRGRALHRLAHPGELRVEHLVAQHVLDLLVGELGLLGAPLVVAELPHRARGVVRQGVEFRFGHAGAVGRIGEQLAPFGLDGLFEQLLDLLERPVEAPAVAQFAGAFAARRRSASSPLRPSVPRRNKRFSALRGAAPASTSSPISSSASRMSYGAASGSGPPCQAPYWNRDLGICAPRILACVALVRA